MKPREIPGRPFGGAHAPFPSLGRVRVLDFTKLLPGPYATRILADLGCRVTKIELPRFADGARRMPPLIDGVGALFLLLNRGKRQLSLDFRGPAGLARVRRLIAESDVLVESFRPGLMDRVGLGAREARRLNPRLIYCSMTGWPPDGPWARKAGHDLNFQAAAGLLGALGRARFPTTQIADLAGSWAAASAILAALLAREKTKKGRHVRVNLAEAAHAFLPVPLAELAAAGRNDARTHQWWNGGHPFYRLYEAADGQSLAVAALERPYAIALLDALGLSHLREQADDPIFHAAGLSRVLADVWRTASAAEWERRLADKDVCVTRVRGVADAAELMTRLRGD